MGQGNKKKQRLVFVIAAAIAAGSVGPEEQARSTRQGDEVEIPAGFGEGVPRTREGYLRTAHNYAVRIDRLSLDPDQVDLKVGGAEAEEAASRELLELGEVIERAGEVPRRVWGQVEQADSLELVLNGVRVEGRVFDLESRARLPEEGVRISGTLPLGVKVRRERELDLREPGAMRTVMAVDFELPAEYFDEVDWQVLTQAPTDALA